MWTPQRQPRSVPSESSMKSKSWESRDKENVEPRLNNKGSSRAGTDPSIKQGLKAVHNASAYATLTSSAMDETTCLIIKNTFIHQYTVSTPMRQSRKSWPMFRPEQMSVTEHNMMSGETHGALDEGMNDAKAEAVEQVTCEICDRTLTASGIADHFEACFSTHCPVAIVDVAPNVCIVREVVHEEWLGQQRVPPVAFLLLFEALPPSSLMSLACTSRCGQQAVDKEELWESRSSAMLAAWWSPAEANSSSLDCGCSLHCTPAATLKASKDKAYLLWRAMNIHTVTFHLKLTNGAKRQIAIQGVRDNTGKRVPVLLHASVLHLRTLFSTQMKMRSNAHARQMRFLRSGGRQLLHASAPLAVYFWDLLEPNVNQPIDSVHLDIDVVLRTSARQCLASNDRLLGDDAFDFMERK